MDRLLRAVRAIVRELIAGTAFHALVRYRVTTMTSGRVRLQIVNPSTGWPNLLPISMQPGAPGLRAELTPGCLVLVSFVEGNQSAPVITHFARPGEAGWRPVTLELDATDKLTLGATASEIAAGAAEAPVVREGDIVTVADKTGPITIGTPLGGVKSRLLA